MKKSLVAVLAMGVLFAAGATAAQDAKAPVQGAAADSASGVDAKAMGPVDEHMQQMQKFNGEMMSTSVPEEPQQLEEHRKSMRDDVGTMNQMSQAHGMMSSMRGAMMGQHAAPGDPSAQMQMMLKCMDMMQTMMDEQGMTGTSAGADTAQKK